MISEDIIQRIKEETDIVALVGETVSLKQTGGRYWGLCPFHNEKTPSFSVRPDKKDFRCFGCGASGDVFGFVMQTMGYSYPESIRYLADRQGIIIEEDPDQKAKQSQRARYYALNREAMRFFYRALLTDSVPQTYLNSRQLDYTIINTFMLGYAPDAWTKLKEAMIQLGFTENELINLGLCSKSPKNDRIYDKYRKRLMFPIFDEHERVIGFGGRIIGEGQPKYLNSSESDIFKKRENLYALNLCRKSLSDSILLVEGYMDVIGLYFHGIEYAVASLGTALTEEQVKKISRLQRQIYICYDGDSAGINATKKAIELFNAHDLNPRIIHLPDHLDPDEYVSKYGRDAFEAKLIDAPESKKYLLKQAMLDLDIRLPDHRMDYINRIVPILSTVELASLRNEYISQIAQDTGIEFDALRYDVESALERLSISSINRHIPYQDKKSDSLIEINKNIWLDCLAYASKSKYHLDFISLFADHMPEPYSSTFSLLSSADCKAVEDKANSDKLDLDWSIVQERALKLPNDITDPLFVEFLKRATLMINRNKINALKTELMHLEALSERSDAEEERYRLLPNEIVRLSYYLQTGPLNL